MDTLTQEVTAVKNSEDQDAFTTNLTIEELATPELQAAVDAAIEALRKEMKERGLRRETVYTAFALNALTRLISTLFTSPGITDDMVDDVLSFLVSSADTVRIGTRREQLLQRMAGTIDDAVIERELDYKERFGGDDPEGSDDGAP